MNSKIAQLVDSAQDFLPLFPWGAEFEKDKFLHPDITSLDVSFASSGIPAGINIPNCEWARSESRDLLLIGDEIQQNECFKNVSLGSVLSAASQDKRVSFLALQDQVRLYSSYLL